MSMYSCGRTTGLVVNSGHGVTDIVPFCEGAEMEHAIEKTEVAGSLMTDYASRLLLGEGYWLQSPSGLETVKEIKEKLCYVAQDYD